MSSNAVFSEYLDYLVVAGLKMSFEDVMRKYMENPQNQVFFLNAYRRLPLHEGKRLHAAFKIINVSGNHSGLINQMINGYEWSNDAEATLNNVIHFVRKNFNMQFPHETNYYDIHVYFNDFDDALYARDALMEMGIKCYDPCYGPVGPHPKGMFECHVTTPKEYYKATLFLSKRTKLTVLVHPNAPYKFHAQHYEHARWINGKLHLRQSW